MTLSVGRFMTPCPVVVDAAATLDKAELLMGEHAVRHLPVTRNDRVVGIVTQSDVSQVLRLCRSGATIPTVAEAMTPAPYTVAPDAPIAEVAERMALESYGCALLAEPGEQELVGIFTSVDALRALVHVLRAGSEP